MFLKMASCCWNHYASCRRGSTIGALGRTPGRNFFFTELRTTKKGQGWVIAPGASGDNAWHFKKCCICRACDPSCVVCKSRPPSPDNYRDRDVAIDHSLCVVHLSFPSPPVHEKYTLLTALSNENAEAEIIPNWICLSEVIKIFHTPQRFSLMPALREGKYFVNYRNPPFQQPLY